MIGNNVRKIRKKKGFSQEKLARLADISLNTLAKIELGFAKKPIIQTVVKLAKALEVSIDELVREVAMYRRDRTNKKQMGYEK